MSLRRFLLAFALAGALPGAALVLMSQPPLPAERAALVVLASIAAFFAAGYWIFLRALARQKQEQAAFATRVASGDLTRAPGAETDPSGDLRRLVISLRRAIGQVQRVTHHLRGTCTEVAERSRHLLEVARRQGSAVDRTLGAVDAMGASLDTAGKRAAQIQHFTKDAAGSLREMTQRMDAVGHVLGGLNALADRQSQAVDEMTERMSAIASSGSELARFSMEADQFVDEVASGIEGVKHRAAETGDLAREVSATAERGQVLVGGSVKGMHQVQKQVQQVAEIVEGLGQRSAEIGRIIDVIEEIADQTNLLSLNASIIAAQAGEHGRPFAVVADAIRGLAERTARSTREIAQLVNAVRGEVSSAVELVGEGRARAAQGVQLGDRAQKALAEIRDTVERTFMAVEETIQETTRLQREGVQVAEASKRVAARVEQVSRAAFDQVQTGRALTEQTREMARLAQDARAQASGQAETALRLSGAVGQLDVARGELTRAHGVLEKGDHDIAGTVAEVREDARRVIRVADGLSRTVDHLYREAEGLEQEVFRFRLPPPRRGGTLRVGVGSLDAIEVSQGFDPLFLTDVAVADIAAGFYSTLVRAGEGGTVLPDLAESWEVDPSGRVYHFRLRPSVRFHDGRRLTAADVKAAFERLVAPGKRSAAAWIFDAVEGVAEHRSGSADAVSGFRFLDDASLEIRLAAPRAFFLHLLALAPTAIGRANGQGVPVGTGPFRVAEMRRGERIVLERHPDYHFRDLPLLDRQELIFCKGPEAALEALQNGRVDVVSNVDPHRLAEATARGIDVVSGGSLTTHFLGMSAQVEPFDDVRVRRALRCLVDVDAGVEEGHPHARAARSLTPPGLPSFDEAAPAPRVDVDEARRLLAEAGHARGLRLVCYGSARSGRESDAFFRRFAEAGVELRQEILANDDYNRRTEAGTLGLFHAGWVADYPDPDSFLYTLCHSRAQGYFQLGLRSEELDRLTEEARASIDPDRRTQLYRRAEAVVREEVPLIPLFHDRTFAALRPHVHGVRLSLTPSLLRTDEVWVDEEAQAPQNVSINRSR